MPKWDVEVTRISYSTRTFTVEANEAWAAEEDAARLAEATTAFPEADSCEHQVKPAQPVEWTPETRYTLLFPVKGGHSYWRDMKTMEVLISDDSIRDPADPTTTDDGRIAVALDRPIKATMFDGKVHFDIHCSGGRTFIAAVNEVNILIAQFPKIKVEIDPLCPELKSLAEVLALKSEVDHETGR